MKLSKFLNITLFVSYFYLKRNVNSYSFNPIVHANQELFSFERIPSHKIRNDVKTVLKNFLSIKVKNILKNIPKLKNTSSINNYNEPDYSKIVLEQIDNLKQQSENKKKIAKRIKQSYENAINDVENNNGEFGLKNTQILKQNLEQIDYLMKQSEELEKKAEYLKEYMKKLNKYKKQKTIKCNIKKNGILKYVLSTNGLKHAIENVEAKIEEDSFTLYYKNEIKKIYLWELIEIPIKIIGNVKQCFFFTYQNNKEIFCSNNELDAFSWINALSEAYFCKNFQIKGTVLNQQLNYDDIKKIKNNNKKNILIVDIKPEQNHTKIFINDIEQNIEDSNEININKLKDNFEEERNNINN